MLLPTPEIPAPAPTYPEGARPSVIHPKGPLRAGWQAVQDPASGDVYYHHVATGHTQVLLTAL